MPQLARLSKLTTGANMSARRKLNTSYVNGSILIGGLAGFAAGSYLVGVVCAGLLLAGALNNRDIR